MFDGSIAENISVITAFVEGLISFFSPCVLPLLPIYLGYLSGGLEDHKPSTRKTIGFTLTFIAGIFTSLLLLNLSMTGISAFFKEAGVWFMRLGGILIVILGVVQLGILKIPLLERTFHIQYDFADKHMSMPIAFMMGFTFAFSWTPCISPTLASILIMASAFDSLWMSLLLIIVYAIGFSLPFLVLSCFAKPAVNFFRTHDTLMQVIVKVGAVILIIMGVVMGMGGLSAMGGTGGSAYESEPSNDDNTAAIPFALKDQNGQEVSLSDYAGKIVYINFWGTWCPVCKQEIGDMQKLYDTYAQSDEVQVLTLVYPNNNREGSVDEIKAFIQENNITFPVLFDEEGSLFAQYGISAYPTVFVIDKNQNIYGYLSGGISYETMENILEQVRNDKNPQ